MFSFEVTEPQRVCIKNKKRELDVLKSRLTFKRMTRITGFQEQIMNS